MEYSFSEFWTEKTRKLICVLNLKYVPVERVSVLMSKGSKSNAIARIHSVNKVLQLGLKIPPGYVIELIWEKFGKLDKESQIKTIIHELLHIPKGFGGGFVQHGKHLNAFKVNKIYKKHQKEIFSLFCESDDLYINL